MNQKRKRGWEQRNSAEIFINIFFCGQRKWVLESSPQLPTWGLRSPFKKNCFQDSRYRNIKLKFFLHSAKFKHSKNGVHHHYIRKDIPTVLGQDQFLPNRPGSGTTKLEFLSLWAFWRDYQTFDSLQFHEIFLDRLPDLQKSTISWFLMFWEKKVTDKDLLRISWQRQHKMTELVTFHGKNLMLHGTCMHVLMFSASSRIESNRNSNMYKEGLLQGFTTQLLWLSRVIEERKFFRADEKDAMLSRADMLL